MVILFNISDQSYIPVENFKKEAERYGDVYELHSSDINHRVSFFLAFGGVDMERIADKISNKVPVDNLECFKITKYYGDDEEAKKWLRSYLI